MRQNTFLYRAYGIVLIVTLSLVCSTQIYADDDKKQSINVENFGRVGDQYYRGAQPEDQDYNDLASIGIKTVINLTSHDADANEKNLVEKAGMMYYQIPMTTHEPPTPSKLTEFLRIATDPTHQPIYVHCVGGKHRTGVMTAVYRMTQQGWSADQAFIEMKKYKFGADFLHPEFKQFVFDFYKQLVNTQSVTAPEVAAAAGANK